MAIIQSQTLIVVCRCSVEILAKVLLSATKAEGLAVGHAIVNSQQIKSHFLDPLTLHQKFGVQNA